MPIITANKPIPTMSEVAFENPSDNCENVVTYWFIIVSVPPAVQIASIAKIMYGENIALPFAFAPPSAGTRFIGQIENSTSAVSGNAHQISTI